MTRDGRLIVISGPSGVGKSTVCAELLRRPGFARVVTCTTRAPRAGEVDGRDYQFLSDAQFKAGIAAGRFLEHADVHGQLYGTPREEVDRLLRAGKNVLLAVDVKGHAQLARDPAVAPAMTSVFLLPPDEETLASRLAARGTEDAARVAIRLQTARAEMLVRDRYDHVVVNKDLTRTVAEVLEIVANAERTCSPSCCSPVQEPGCSTEK